MKPKISIIIPVYNSQDYLSKCLDSVINQTLKEIEIILINDGSTDKSDKIIKKYLEKYPQKIVYHQKENEGQGIARNIGINLAKGEYLTFIDSDDWVEESMLEKMYEIAIKEKADIIASTSMIEHRNDNLINTKYPFDSTDPYKKYILNNSGPCAKLIKKNIITKNELTFPKLRAYEDIAVVPLWGIFSNKIVFINESFYHYKIHEGSTMKQTVYNDKLMNIYDALNNLFDVFTKKTKNKYQEELEYIYIEHLLHAASLRFLEFNKFEELTKIKNIIKEKFPKWNKNKYYQTKNIKYKIVCSLLYKEKYKLLKMILK